MGKIIGTLVADLEEGECDLLFSYDMEHLDALLACDILKDAVGMLQQEYDKALERFRSDMDAVREEAK